jgi:hypothetical protein
MRIAPTARGTGNRSGNGAAWIARSAGLWFVFIRQYALFLSTLTYCVG